MIFPGFPAVLSFFQVFQVEWEPCLSHPAAVILVSPPQLCVSSLHHSDTVRHDSAFINTRRVLNSQWLSKSISQVSSENFPKCGKNHKLYFIYKNISLLCCYSLPKTIVILIFK